MRSPVPWLDIILLILLILVCIAGTLLTVLQLPGIWLIVVAAGAYGWYYDWQVIGLWTLAVLAAIAAAAEVGELLSGVWLARRGGGSRRAGWWGLIGGIAGALVLTIPVPIVGTVLGAAVGCFAGALLAELSLQKKAADGARVGLYAAVGQTLGTTLKIAAAVMMSGIAVTWAIVAA